LPEPPPEAAAPAPPLPVTKVAPSAGTDAGAQGGNRGSGRGGRGGGRGGGNTGGRSGGEAGASAGGGRAGGGRGANGGGNTSSPSGGAAGGGRGGGGRGGGQGRPQRSVIWVEETPGTLMPIQVRTGLTDGTRTEVSAANLKEGTEVVVSDISQTTTAPAARPANSPLVPQVGGGRGRGGF